MKTRVVHPGMSYTNSFFKSDKITFVVEAECLGNAFSNIMCGMSLCKE